MTRLKSIAALAGILALAACEKNAVQDITGTVPAAKIRFFNFGLNAPQVHFFANDTKLTGVLSTAGAPLNTGVSFGGVAAGGFYSGIEPGNFQFSAQISDTTIKNVKIANITQNVEAGKTYSFYISGLYNTTTRTADGFIVEDNYPNTFNYTRTMVRFVNAIYNSQPMTLYGVNTSIVPNLPEATIGGAVAYKAAGAFVELPCGSYDLVTRVAGSNTPVISRAAVSFNCGRVYTITARGDITVPGTTATNRPFLDNTANR